MAFIIITELMIIIICFFADKCWQIVRTIEKGGVKLIYNCDPVDGTCNTTSNYVRPVISVNQKMPVTGSETPDDPYRFIVIF